MKELQVPTKTQLFQRLLEEYAKGRDSDALTITTFEEVERHDAVIEIAGYSGAGKTYTLRAVLQEYMKRNHPIFLFDSVERREEHDYLPKAIKPIRARALTWTRRPAGYRLKLESDLGQRRQSVRDLAAGLLVLEGNVKLAPWVLAVEEAADYSQIESFRTLLRRMRKTFHKIIVTSSEPDRFPMAEQFRVLPH